MNDSKEIDINNLVYRLKSKVEEYKRIDDNSHNLLNLYFDQLVEEINEQSYVAYRMLSDHFDNMSNAVMRMKNELLQNVPNESLRTRMTFWTMSAEEIFETNTWSPKKCADLFKQEQDITALVTRKFYEYTDFKKALLAPIKENIDMHSIFGQLILKDFFHLRVPRNKFKFLTVSMDGTFRKWVSTKHECTETFQSNEEVAFSKLINGSVLLTIGERVKIWDLNSFKLLKSLPKFDDFVKSYKLNGNKIFVSFENGLLECWNLDDQKCIFSILAHNKLITSIKLIQNKYILTSGKDAKIFLWNYDTGEQIRSFEAHKDKVFRLKLIADTIFASCSADKTICIWNIANNKCIKMLVGHQSKILNLKFGNNILVSASFDCTIRYWDGNNGKILKILKGHTQGIAYLKLFPEDNKMVSTSVDRVILVWDFIKGECLQKFVGHDDFILAAKMVYRDFLLSASHDGTVKIWTVDNNNYLASYQDYLSPIISVHQIE